MTFYKKYLKAFSRDLRKNMTYCEKLLWQKLRKKQLKGKQFYRQRPLGNYIVDFYCPAVKLVVEVDGGQHFTEAGKQKDMVRDKYLNSLGLKVLRYSDKEVYENINNVLEEIYSFL
jgi:very-short-patch-repair endonuclease